MKRRRIELVFLLLMSISAYMFFFGGHSLEQKLAFIALYSVCLLITLYSLMLENRSSHHTLVWMGILVCLPIIGYIFYLYSGQLYLKGRLFQTKRKRSREAWKKLAPRADSLDLNDLKEHQKKFAVFADHVSQTSFSTGTRTKVLKNGKETFGEILKKLQSAKEYIHIEYYIFRSDRIGRKVMDILCEKARDGVEVLFIYDAAGSYSLAGKDIRRMEKAGVKVRPFLPLKHGFYNQKFNFRNHRKIIIVDGDTGFVGGLNVGDEYLGKNRDIGFWRDTHMELEGEAVYTLHTVFLLDWEYASGERVLKGQPEMRRKEAGDGGAVQVVASGPDTQQGVMSDFYYALLSCAEKFIWIATPYFVPNEAIRAALKHAARKGIDVRLLIPDINDSFLTEYASRSFFQELLDCGVNIYLYQKGFLHQKVIIVDGDTASVGTANMDMRSFHLNFEVNVFLLNTPSIQELSKQFKEDLQESELVLKERYENRPLWERSKESFARLFSNVL